MAESEEFKGDLKVRPCLKHDYKEAMNSLKADIKNQKPLLSYHKTFIMYSDIILSTFDAFQAQQGNLIKAQHVAKNNTHHGSEQRHRLLSSSSLGHALSIGLLSSCRSQHREGEIGHAGTAKVRRAS